MPPTLILLVGMATILGGIVLLRLNAFLALIIAAIVVSLLAPGEPAVKIARVAEGFGRTAGTVGVVSALAAITGKAMTDSGAADRIVNGFLALLGEKRGATALCSTGYILSIPVFFDTVFYLLVPLARSMYGRTNRNYLKYLLAIAAGAGATHTLVPPTPGTARRDVVGAGALHGGHREPQPGAAAGHRDRPVGVRAASQGEPCRPRGDGGDVVDERRGDDPDHCGERGVRRGAAGDRDRVRDRASVRGAVGGGRVRDGLRHGLSLPRVRGREPDKTRPRLEHRRDDHDRGDAGSDAAGEWPSVSHCVCRHRDRQRVARRDMDERQRVLAVFEDGRRDGDREPEVVDPRAGDRRRHGHGDDARARAARATAVAFRPCSSSEPSYWSSLRRP